MRLLNLADPTARVVRAAVASDAQVLAHLCTAHAAYEQLAGCAPDHAEQLRAALATGLLHVWLLMECDVPVGYASVTVDYSTLGGCRFAHLDCLYLQPAARGRGAGRALLQAALEFARAHGCAEIQWQTPTWNHRAIRFYDRQGATRLPKQRYTLPVSSCVPDRGPAS